MKKALLIAAALSSFLFAGCSHPMRITNMDNYFTPPSPPRKEVVKLGVTSPNSVDPQNSRYVNAVVDSLQRSGNFEKVIYPYSQSVHDVDIAVDLSVSPHYSGNGSNFLVSWPGFLIFAPAIWGYGYNAEIDTNANITYLKVKNSNQIAIPTKYTFRQAEMDRTWTEIGWLEVSLIPFIGGFAFTQYDPDVTDEFITKVSPNYGPYVAQKIIAAIDQK